MPATDPIADMLTRIRNANRVGAEEVEMPASRVKVGIAKILREEGFIKHYKIARVAGKAKDKKASKERHQEKGGALERQSVIRIYLKYGAKQEKVIGGLRRISKPGLRRYVGWSEVPLVEGGLGITILSTSRGLLTGAQARKRKTGGELLCAIW